MKNYNFSPDYFWSRSKVRYAVSCNRKKIDPKIDSNSHFTTSVCFKPMLTELPKEGNKLDKSVFAHILIDDFTSFHTKTTEFSYEYLSDVSKNFSPVIKQDIIPDFFKEDFKEINYIIIDISKLNGVLFLGLMNLFKVTIENPTIPITYCYMKEKYPELTFYQRLVLCSVLTLKEFSKGFRTLCGEHAAFNNKKVGNVHDLTLKKIVDTWEKLDLFNPDKSLLKKQQYKLNSNSTMNGCWLPDPWAYKTERYSLGYYLNDETVNLFLNPSSPDIPTVYNRTV